MSTASVRDFWGVCTVSVRGFYRVFQTCEPVGHVYWVCQTFLSNLSEVFIESAPHLSDVFIKFVSHVYGIRQAFLPCLVVIFTEPVEHIYGLCTVGRFYQVYQTCLTHLLVIFIESVRHLTHLSDSFTLYVKHFYDACWFLSSRLTCISSNMLRAPDMSVRYVYDICQFLS